MGIKRTKEFRNEAVRIALTGGLRTPRLDDLVSIPSSAIGSEEKLTGISGI